MRKPYIQVLVNSGLIIIFLAFLLINKELPYYPCKDVVWVPVSLICIVIMLVFKYIFFRRQNIFLLLVATILFMILVVLNLSNLNGLFTDNIGVIVCVPGLSLILTYLKYKEKFQLKTGLLIFALGILLILIK